MSNNDTGEIIPLGSSDETIMSSSTKMIGNLVPSMTRDQITTKYSITTSELAKKLEALEKGKKEKPTVEEICGHIAYRYTVLMGENNFEGSFQLAFNILRNPKMDSGFFDSVLAKVFPNLVKDPWLNTLKAIISA